MTRVAVTCVYGAEDDVAELRRACDAENVGLVVYDKMNECRLMPHGIACVPSPNVGREQHAFVQYVLDTYDDLPDEIFFIPTPLAKHDRFARFKSLLAGEARGEWTSDGHFRTLNCEAHFTIHCHEGRFLVPACVEPFKAWYEEFIGPWVPWDPKARGPAYNGVMRTTRDRILRHPPRMYAELLRQLSVHTDTEAAHFMERAMAAAF
jgi:hypothetical protein